MSRITLAILVLIIVLVVIKMRTKSEPEARTNASDRALIRANTQAQLVLTESMCGGFDSGCVCNGNETV